MSYLRLPSRAMCPSESVVSGSQTQERRRLDAVADLMKCYGMLRLRRGEACLAPWFTFPSRDAGVYILRRNPIRRDEACLAPTPRQHEIANSIGLHRLSTC